MLQYCSDPVTNHRLFRFAAVQSTTATTSVIMIISCHNGNDDTATGKTNDNANITNHATDEEAN